MFCVVIKQTGSGGGGKLSKWARHIARSNRSGKGNTFEHKILRHCYSRFIQSHSKVSKLAPSTTGGYMYYYIIDFILLLLLLFINLVNA